MSNLDEVLKDNMQSRNRAAATMRDELTKAADAREAAEAVLAEATARFEDLVIKAYETQVIPVNEIYSAARVPRSRVYQITKRAAARTEA